MEQAVLSNEAIKSGFRIEDGKVVKYILGEKGELIRKRRNWQNSIRQKSRQFIKDKCESCKSPDNLSIHHKVPISKGGLADRENCITLCWYCHGKEHNIIRQREHRKIQQSFVKGEWGEYRIVI